MAATDDAGAAVMDDLLIAIFRRGRPRTVLHHSDQGSQDTGEDFQRSLDSHGIVCSMSRRGNCWDSAVMESFFSTLKTERLSKKHYRTKDDLRADVFDYIDRFHNPRRAIPLSAISASTVWDGAWSNESELFASVWPDEYAPEDHLLTAVDRHLEPSKFRCNLAVSYRSTIYTLNTAFAN